MPLAFDLICDLGERLDLAGSHHRAGEVALLDRREARGVELLAVAAGGHDAERREQHDPQADEAQAPVALLVAVPVTVRHPYSISLD